MKKLFCFYIAALLFISTSQAQVNPPSVKIGGQTWMVKNLDVATYRDGTPIPEVTDATAWSDLTTGAWCYLENDSANGTSYGKLYNWYAVTDPRGLAPIGYHVPSDEEWSTLYNYLGDDTAAGGAMKEIGLTHWRSPNTGATNSSGFTGLPGGYRNGIGATTENVGGGYSVWWSSSEEDSKYAWYLLLCYYDGAIFTSPNSKKTGNSVRCIKD